MWQCNVSCALKFWTCYCSTRYATVPPGNASSVNLADNSVKTYFVIVLDWLLVTLRWSLTFPWPLICEIFFFRIHRQIAGLIHFSCFDSPPLNPCCFQASDWSSDFCVFSNKKLVGWTPSLYIIHCGTRQVWFNSLPGTCFHWSLVNELVTLIENIWIWVVSNTKSHLHAGTNLDIRCILSDDF